MPIRLPPGTKLPGVAKTKRARLPKSEGVSTNPMLCWLRAEGLPLPVVEYAFAKSLGRDFRFDWAWPGLIIPWGGQAGLAVELEGGTRRNGRHNRADGYERDCEKYSLAALLKWSVLRFTSKQFANNAFIPFLEVLLKGAQPEVAFGLTRDRLKGILIHELTKP